MRTLRVLMFDHGGALAGLSRTMRDCGYAVVAGPPSAEVDGALALARRLRPDLVLLAADHPQAPTLSGRLADGRVAPVIWASPSGSHEVLERARGARAAALVRAGAEPFDVQAAVELAVASFRQRCHLEKTVARLEETLQARKMVERAKGLLMEQFGLRESEAYDRLRRLAMDSRRSLREVAETILAVADVGAVPRNTRDTGA